MTPLFLPLTPQPTPADERPQAAPTTRKGKRRLPAPEAGDGGVRVALPAEGPPSAEGGLAAAALEAARAAHRAEAPMLAIPISEPVARSAANNREKRLVFVTLRTEGGRSGPSRLQVELEWRGARFAGDFVHADPLGARLEPVALATLAAVEAVCRSEAGGVSSDAALSLEGVVVVEALDRRYVLASLHAGQRPHLTNLSGLAGIDRGVSEAVVVATLRAVDRWIRGRLGGGC
jgi:hypothetical protein